MLQSIRGTVGSWVAKGLFILLIASFAVWGIGDIFRGASPQSIVATVGPFEISAGEVQNEFNKQVRRFAPLFGGEFDAEQARQLGLVDRALNTLIERALFQLAAREAGLQIGDDLVRATIEAQPAFRNPAGGFDPALFRQILRANSLTEAGYVALMKEELARELLVRAVVEPVRAPTPLVKALYRHRAERRTADALVIRPGTIAIDEPTDPEVLRRSYRDHPVSYTAPAYRALTVVSLNADAFADRIAVTEDELREAFDTRADEFVQPERRTIRQVVLSSEPLARELAAAARAAGSLDTAAEAAGQSAVTLEDVTENELPAFGAVAFALEAGEIGGPVQSLLGWHVVSVAAVTPGSTADFAEVRDQVLDEVRRERAIDLMYEEANRLDDRLAGGTALDVAASELGLPVTKIAAIDADGTGPDGAPVALADAAEVVALAFDLDAGGQSLVTETQAGDFFVVRIDGITPPTLRPFDEVKDAVLADWRAEQQREQAATAADTLVERLAAGATVAALAEQTGHPAVAIGPVTRDGDGTGDRDAELLSEAALARLFTLAPGEAAAAPAASGGRLVLDLTEIIPADPDAPDAALAPVTATVNQGLASDLVAQFLEALRGRHDVSIDRELLAETFALP